MNKNDQRANQRAADRLLTRATKKAAATIRTGGDPRPMLEDAIRSADLLLEEVGTP